MSEQIKKELPSNPDQDASTVDGYIPEIGTIIPENAPTIHDKSAFTSENAPVSMSRPLLPQNCLHKQSNLNPHNWKITALQPHCLWRIHL